MNRIRGTRGARLTVGAACAMLVAALGLAGTAAAHTVSLHKYSGTYPASSIDGHDAVGTPGSPTIAGSIYDLDIDQASGALYAAVSNPEGVYKFNLAGVSQPFSGLSGKTFLETAVSGDSDLEVDNSGTATQGRIYVFPERGPVKAFNPSGTPVAGFTEISGGDICGAAVSPTGTLWLGIYTNTVKEFNPNGTPTGNEFQPSGVGLCDLEIDTAGNFYIPTSYGGGQVNKYNPSGEFVGQIDPGPSVRVPGIDRSNNDIFDDNQSNIRHYSAGGGSLISVFGGAEGTYPGLQGSNGIAIDKATHKVYAGNNRGPSTIDIFEPLAPIVVPDVSTGAATGITKVDATLHGIVNPDSSPTTDCHFEYGTVESSAFGTSIDCAEGKVFAGGSGDHPVTAELSGLTPETKYHFRLVANNANGAPASVGEEATFSTEGAVKNIHTTPATEITLTSARLNGTLDPAGEVASYHFQYGTSTSYGLVSPIPDDETGPAAGDTPVHADVAKLTPGATYHYRIVASNGFGTSKGEDMVFKASAKPTVTPYVSDVHSDSAEIHVVVNPSGESTTYTLEYGSEDCEVSTCTAAGPTPVGSGLTDQEASTVVTGLESGTTYHYRVLAENARGTTSSGDRTFTTFPFTEVLEDHCPNALARQQTGAALLLDCRAYELVSAANAGGYDVESDLLPGQAPLDAYPAASDALLYSLHLGAVPGVSGNPTNLGRDPYVADRTSNGWETRYVGLPATGMADPGRFGSPLLGAAADMSVFAFGGPDICDPCFAGHGANIPLRQANGALVQGMAGSLDPGPAEPAGEVRKPVSGDGSHLIFGSTAKYESDGNANGTDVTIYERDLSAKTTQVVSKLPDGQTIAAGNEVAELDVSNDGSRTVVGRVLSTDAKGNRYYHLYMHVGSSPNTVDLTPGVVSGAEFDGMTSDGSKVFFTTADPLASDADTSTDIYETEVDGAGVASQPQRISTGSGVTGDTDSCNPEGEPAAWNSPIGPGKCNVVAFAGGAGVASGDGTFYFVSPEQLDGANGIQDQANLYVVKPGDPPHFVATIDTSIGKPGPAPLAHPVVTGGFGGSFNNPSGLTVDQSNGDVFVAEVGTGKVHRFTSAGAPKPFTAGTDAGTNTLTGFEWPYLGAAQVAVDNSPGPANGDIYVVHQTLSFQGFVDVYSPTGAHLGQLTGSGDASGSLGFPCGVAVDQADGSVYIGDYFGHVWRYTPAGATVVEADYSGAINTGAPGSCGVAASKGNVLVHMSEQAKVVAFHTADFALGLPPEPAPAPIAEEATGVGTDPATGDVYVDKGNKVAVFDKNGVPLETIGEGGVAGSTSAAVRSSNQHLFVSSGTVVKEFGSFQPPWTPVDQIAVQHGENQAAVHSYGDFQVTPSGSAAVFTSGQPLVSYDNNGHSEVYRYSTAGAGTLDCVSCAPTNAQASGDSALASHGLSLTDDGRVFFTSADALAPRDLDKRKDAYEWKDGETQLISTGTSPADSSMLSASSDGRDAFFFTRDILAPQDENGHTVKVYDAREEGGFFVFPPREPCAASDECHGPGTQAAEPPNINTVEGSGRAPTPPREACKRGFVRKHGKCVRRHRKHHRKNSRSHG
jgi:hypothetical protein